MGWLGWTEAETLDTSMSAIVLAHRGRERMIRDVLELTGLIRPAGEEGEAAAAPAEPVAPATGEQVRSALRMAMAVKK
jgi:hypothetical protein